MTILDWLGSVGVIITILATVICGTWWLQRKFLLIEKDFLLVNQRIDNLEHRIDKLEQRLDKTMEIISEAIVSMLKIEETIVSVLARANLILAEEQITLYKSYTIAHTNMCKISLNWMKEKPNPFTKEEAERLQEYGNMTLEGKKFSLAQVIDYHQIVDNIQEEYWRALKAGEKVPSIGAGLGILIAMSAFILGGALAEEDKDKKQQEVRNKN